MNKTTMRYRPMVSKLLRSPKLVKILVAFLYLVTISSIAYNFSNNKINIGTAIFEVIFVTGASILFTTLFSYARFQSRQNELSNIRIERSIIRLSESLPNSIVDDLHQLIKRDSNIIEKSIKVELKKIEINTNILTNTQNKHFSDTLISLQDSTRLVRNTMKNLLNEQVKTSTETQSKYRIESAKKLDSMFTDHSFKALIGLQKINSEIILMKQSIENFESAQSKKIIND